LIAGNVPYPCRRPTQCLEADPTTNHSVLTSILLCRLIGLQTILQIISLDCIYIAETRLPYHLPVPHSCQHSGAYSQTTSPINQTSVYGIIRICKGAINLRRRFRCCVESWSSSKHPRESLRRAWVTTASGTSRQQSFSPDIDIRLFHITRDHHQQPTGISYIYS
jgi:hypothetical protein